MLILMAADIAAIQMCSFLALLIRFEYCQDTDRVQRERTELRADSHSADYRLLFPGPSLLYHVERGGHQGGNQDCHCLRIFHSDTDSRHDAYAVFYAEKLLYYQLFRTLHHSDWNPPFLPD